MPKMKKTRKPAAAKVVKKKTAGRAVAKQPAAAKTAKKVNIAKETGEYTYFFWLH